jgi:hypothetical protein
MQIKEAIDISSPRANECRSPASVVLVGSAGVAMDVRHAINARVRADCDSTSG